LGIYFLLFGIYFSCDASGQRIVKKVIRKDGSIASTYYLRDASGNVMSVYEYNSVSDDIPQLSEQYLYGSSRIGVYTPVGAGSITSAQGTVFGNRGFGRKSYELSDHLGNVRATLSDYRRMDSAQIVNSATDYYPFGMAIVGRSYSSSNQYRYGFNGKEHEYDIASGDYDFGARVYDSRLGRWLSLEPLLPLLPGSSPYTYSVNNPLFYREPDGKWFEVSIKKYNKKGEQITWGWFGLRVAKKEVTYKLSEFYFLNESSRELNSEDLEKYKNDLEAKLLKNFNTSDEGIKKSDKSKKTIIVNFEFSNNEGLKIINSWDEIESKKRAHLVLIVDPEEFNYIAVMEGGATDTENINGFSPSGTSMGILPSHSFGRFPDKIRRAAHELGHGFFRLRDRKKSGLMYNQSDIGDGLSYKEFKRAASWFTRTFKINGGVYNPNPNKNKIKKTK
jgi:RHS repeat-associated protein